MNNNLENEEEKLEFDEPQEEPGDNIPAPTDIGWSDYVMSHFAEDEKFQGNPTVDGLRRVAELLLGDIIEAKSQVVQTPTGNDKRATVVHTVRFLYNDVIKSFDGCADAYWGNTDKIYNKFPVAMAETRAEARSLRRALKLKHIVAAEELSDVALIDDIIPDEIPEKITNNQINFIDILCRNDTRGSNINIQKFIQNQYSNIKNINDLKHSESLILQELLSKYQQDRTTIPEEIGGYDTEWRTNFG